MQDIRHGDDGTERSIRNIPVGHRRPARSSAVADRPAPLPRRRRRSGRFWLFALGVAVLVAIGGVLVSTVFAGARVTVYPRTETVVLPATLQAQANAPAGVLPYQTVSVTRSASQSVPAQSVQKVSRPASLLPLPARRRPPAGTAGRAGAGRPKGPPPRQRRGDRQQRLQLRKPAA